MANGLHSMQTCVHVTGTKHCESGRILHRGKCFGTTGLTGVTLISEFETVIKNNINVAVFKPASKRELKVIAILDSDHLSLLSGPRSAVTGGAPEDRLRGADMTCESYGSACSGLAALALVMVRQRPGSGTGPGPPARCRRPSP